MGGFVCYVKKLEFYVEGNEKLLGSFKQGNEKIEFVFQNNYFVNRLEIRGWEVSQEVVKSFIFKEVVVRQERGVRCQRCVKEFNIKG